MHENDAGWQKTLRQKCAGPLARLKAAAKKEETWASRTRPKSRSWPKPDLDALYAYLTQAA
jgi:hypothetical protein